MLPPREPFAVVTREAVESHQDWDSLYSFQVLRWDGTQLTADVLAIIDTRVHPGAYPKLMARIAAEHRAENPHDPAYAYLIQGEFYGAARPPPSATDEERRQYEIDSRVRGFSGRPDATEAAIAWCADVHGRLWAATKTRDYPDHVTEAFYPPGRRPDGSLIRGLLDVAATTGKLAYGLPGWDELPLLN